MQKNSNRFLDMVESHPEWITCDQALQLVTDIYFDRDHQQYAGEQYRISAAINSAKSAILRRLFKGSLASKAQSFECRINWVKIECDADTQLLPTRFWQQMFYDVSSNNIDWVAGDFSFERDSQEEPTDHGHAFGVHFDRNALPALQARSIAIPNALEPRIQANNLAGAPRKWDWDGALLHLAARAHHHPDGLLRLDGGDPNQSDIAEYLSEWFIGTKKMAPADSQLRDYGKRFLIELNTLKSKLANNP